MPLNAVGIIGVNYKFSKKLLNFIMSAELSLLYYIHLLKSQTSELERTCNSKLQVFFLKKNIFPLNPESLLYNRSSLSA